MTTAGASAAAEERFRLPLNQPPVITEAAGVGATIAAYPATKFAVAEDPWGQVASWHPPTDPHRWITGGHRSGKTQTVQNLAVQLARAHWAVYIIARHDDEYRQFRGWPNVRYVATHPADEVTVARHLTHLLHDRTNALRAGIGEADRNAPVVVLVDGAHTELVAPHDREVITGSINDVLRLGRAVRMHVVLAGGDAARHLSGADTVAQAQRLDLRVSPYTDGFVPGDRDLTPLRPTQSSYPPLDIGHTRTPTGGDVVDYPMMLRVGRPMKGRSGVGRTESTAVEEPDIEVGRYAARTFTVDRGRGVLMPASIAAHLDSSGVDSHTVWQGGVCLARCAHGYDHAAPDGDCSCGIYGATTLASLRSQFPDLAAWIVAVIAAEGPTIIGSAGLRTSAARVVAWWCHPGPVFDDARTVLAQQCTHAEGFDDLAAMLANYNIPATTVDMRFLAEGLGGDWFQRISLGRIDQPTADRFWSRPARRHISAVVRSARWLATKLAPPQVIQPAVNTSKANQHTRSDQP